MADNKNVYEIGAMAGAISAGAYSAGVVDFLFQALHEWELAKRDDPDNVPAMSSALHRRAPWHRRIDRAALAAVCGGRLAAGEGRRPGRTDSPTVASARRSTRPG